MNRVSCKGSDPESVMRSKGKTKERMGKDAKKRDRDESSFDGTEADGRKKGESLLSEIERGRARKVKAKGRETRERGEAQLDFDDLPTRTSRSRVPSLTRPRPQTQPQCIPRRSSLLRRSVHRGRGARLVLVTAARDGPRAER